MLSRVLPFDDQDDKEIARKTIQDNVDFEFEPWEQVSQAAKDVCSALLKKNRHRRPNLERILSMDWFQEYQDVSDARRNASPETRFAAYALTSTNAVEINAEIARV